MIVGRDVGQLISADNSDPFQESPYLFHLWHANWINVGMQTYLQGWLLAQSPFLYLLLPSFFSLCKPPSFIPPQSVHPILPQSITETCSLLLFLLYSFLSDSSSSCLIFYTHSLFFLHPSVQVIFLLPLSSSSSSSPPLPVQPSSHSSNCVVLNAGTWSWLIL